MAAIKSKYLLLQMTAPLMHKLRMTFKKLFKQVHEASKNLSIEWILMYQKQKQWYFLMKIASKITSN